MLQVLAHALLVLAVFALVAPAVHRLLAYRLEIAPGLAIVLAIGAGAAAAAGLVWLTWNPPPVECIDFTPDPSGRC